MMEGINNEQNLLYYFANEFFSRCKLKLNFVHNAASFCELGCQFWKYE